MTFVVFGLPRSRTFWLSRFLSYGGWECGHDEARHMRSVGDVRAWLAQPSTGTVETAAAPFWRTLRQLAPDARVVVVRRPVGDVVASLQRLGIAFDAAALLKVVRGLDAKLDQIEARWPGALSVQFDDLKDETTCAAVFEHCLPLKHDAAWWRMIAPMNLQTNLPALLRYCEAFRPQLEKVASQIKHKTLTTMRLRPAVEADGMTFQQEPFRSFYAEAKPLFEEHLVQTEQSPDAHGLKNLALLEMMDDMGALQVMTARSNGRMFGYLMSAIGPSLDSPKVTQAWHTIFFASPDCRGLGMKLQRAALQALRNRGVDEVLMRAGVRGSGPRLGTIYKRLGAEDFGRVYRLELEA